MVKNFKKLMKRAFPAFAGGYHLTKKGVIVGIPDYSDSEEQKADNEETGTDRHRPIHAVNVQQLTPGGVPDTKRKVLKNLALPGLFTGDGTGEFKHPKIGTIVRLAFDYGNPGHPYIQSVLFENQPVPFVVSGDSLKVHNDNAFEKVDSKGDWIRQTDGSIIDDSHKRNINADELDEVYGSVKRQVDGDVEDSGDGSLTQDYLGALIQDYGGDSIQSFLGSESRSIGGEKIEKIALALQLISGLDMTLTSNLGGASIGSQLAGFEASALGKIFIGNMTCELVAEVHATNQDMLDLMTACKQLAYANGGGGTGGAVNGTVVFTAIEAKVNARLVKIELIKE